MFCPNCGKEINDELARFCDECGEVLFEDEETAQEPAPPTPDTVEEDTPSDTQDDSTAQPPSSGTTPPSASTDKNKKIILPVIISVAAVLVFLVVFLLLRSDGDKKDTDIASTTESTSGETESYNEETKSFELPSDTTEHDRNEWIEETKAQETQKATEPADSSIDITSDLQYDVNIFLSNFSESKLGTFIGSPEKDEILYYALSYNFINKPDVYEKGTYGSYDGRSCNIRISEDEIEKTVSKYFDISVKPSFHQQFLNYSDGYYYANSADFKDYGYTVVSKLEKSESNLYIAHFDIYSDGVSHNYNMTPSQAEKLSSSENSSLAKLGSGTAKIKATDIYNRSTYILNEYSVTRKEAQVSTTHTTTAVHTSAPSAPIQGTTSAYDNETVEYMYPTDTKELTTEYLSTLNREQIIILTNEIYARHGYIFKSEKLQRYFSKRSWYNGYEPSMEVVSQKFSKLEHRNLKIIVDYKESIGME